MSVKEELMQTLRENITEENTDELIEYLFDKLPIPWYLRPLAGIGKSFVDRLLPERLLDAIEHILNKGE